MYHSYRCSWNNIKHQIASGLIKVTAMFGNVRFINFFTVTPTYTNVVFEVSKVTAMAIFFFLVVLYNLDNANAMTT